MTKPWRTAIIRPNQFSRPTTKMGKVKGILVHYTANHGGTAQNHKDYFNNLKGRYASAHIFVDKNEAVLIIPLDEVTYHANDVQRYVGGRPYRGVQQLLPNANYNSVGIEMCQEWDGSIHPETVRRTTLVAKELCRMFGLNPQKDIFRHYDVTGKNCPAPWVSNPTHFTNFKKAVASGAEPVAPKLPEIKENAIGIVTITYRGSDGLDIKPVPSFNSQRVGVRYAPASFQVYEEKNGLYNVGGNQWITANKNFVSFTPKEKEVQKEIKFLTGAEIEKSMTKDDKHIGMVYVVGSHLGIYEKPDIKSKKIRDTKNGNGYRVYSIQGNMLNVGGNQWIENNKGAKFVQAVPFYKQTPARYEPIEPTAVQVSSTPIGKIKIKRVGLYGIPIYKTSSLQSNRIGLQKKYGELDVYGIERGMAKIKEGWIVLDDEFTDFTFTNGKKTVDEGEKDSNLTSYIQHRLNIQGYRIAKTGEYDLPTKGAVTRLQRERQEDANGTMTLDLLGEMKVI